MYNAYLNEVGELIIISDDELAIIKDGINTKIIELPNAERMSYQEQLDQYNRECNMNEYALQALESSDKASASLEHDLLKLEDLQKRNEELLKENHSLQYQLESMFQDITDLQSQVLSLQTRDDMVSDDGK